MLKEKEINSNFKIRYFRDFPQDIQAIKTKAFAHSILTPEAQKLDDSGLKCALFYKEEFLAGLTLSNQKSLENWMGVQFDTSVNFHYLQRGFHNRERSIGKGSSLLLLLLLYIIEGHDYYASVKKETKSIFSLFHRLNFKEIDCFQSYHQIENIIDLHLFKYAYDPDVLNNERKFIKDLIKNRANG